MAKKIIIKGSNALKTAFVEIIETLGYTPAGSGTRAAITKDSGYSMEIMTEDHKGKYYATGAQTFTTTYRVYNLPTDWDLAMKATKAAFKEPKVKIPLAPKVGYTIQMSNLKVGDKVIVTKTGTTYTAYEAMFKAMGFKNLQRNCYSTISNHEQRIATVFHIMPHLVHKTEKYPLVAIRFSGGEELLIGEEGVAKFAGFKVGDKMMVETTDPYLSTVPKESRNKAATYTGHSSVRGWHNVKFSDDSTNSFTQLRYATPAEIDAARPPAKEFTIGNAETSKMVSVSSTRIVYVQGGGSLDFAHIKEVRDEMRSFKTHLAGRYWAMDIPFVNIGCTKMISYEQLDAIVKYAQSVGHK